MVRRIGRARGFGREGFDSGLDFVVLEVKMQLKTFYTRSAQRDLPDG